MKRKEIIFLSLIIVLAVLSRLAFLDLRILHHDEGVNYFFANGILESGRFVYNPENYHGPFYFFAIAVSFILFGVSEFSLRFPAAIFGILIVILPLFFYRKEFGKYVAPILLLISPSLMYYSRYSIHEIAFALFSLIGVYSLTLILERKDLKYLPLFAISLAFLFAVKETVIIMLFIFLIIILINFSRVKKINFKSNSRIIWISVFAFLFVYVLLFNSFFMNFSGLIDSFKGFLPWFNRGLQEIGHDKPFYYYGLILFEYELPILAFALVGLFYLFFYRKNIFLLNFSIWAFLSFLIYSFIPYKTPWLIINIVMPLCFIASFGIKQIKYRYKWIFILISLLYLTSASLYVNYGFPWQEENRLAYVHTDIDILRLVERVKDYDNPRILMASKEYWPLPFYFHGFDVNYLDGDFEGYKNYSDYNLFIFNAQNFSSDSVPIDYNYDNYKLRSGVELVLVGS